MFWFLCGLVAGPLFSFSYRWIRRLLAPKILKPGLRVITYLESLERD
jgi:hypothetical protein